MKASRAPISREIEIDLKGLRSKAAMFERISAALRFPAHFGYNLDALYDCLTDLPITLGKPLQVTLAGVGRGQVVLQVAAVFDEASAWFARQGLRLTVRRT